ncbi:MAG: chromate transporter [Defluviitaleaceae bacterium]|nr:chromate transporter [Defluviitaleaceae bacterium]
MKILLDLYITFAKVGGLTFGGGYAMLPIMQKEVSEKKGWATEVEVADYFALAQSIPGLFSVNSAIFIGYKQKGVLGSVVSALGIVSPSIFIVTILAIFMNRFLYNPIVYHAFAGIRVAVCVLIFGAIINLWKKNMKGIVAYTLFAIAFCVSLFTSISVVFIVIAAIFTGIILMQIKKRGVIK